MRFLSFAGAGCVTLLLALAAVPRAAHAAVNCDGTQTEVVSGVWSVDDSVALQDRTPLASGGPNLMVNGDFTFNELGQNVDLVNTARPWYNLNGAEGTWGTQMLIANWTYGGGGSNSYPRWGVFFQYPSNYPMARIDNTSVDCSMSAVYLGNWEGQYTGVTQDVASTLFNADGVGYNADLVLNPFSASYGTFETPEQISQPVSLSVGRMYRLQFMQGSEIIGNNDRGPGVAAVGITGYPPIYFDVTITGKYYTIDFVAKAAQTEISFKNWGHISLLGPPLTGPCGGGPGTCATEIMVDDVILTECSNSPPGPAPTPGGGCKGGAALASTRPAGKVQPTKSFTYSATLVNSRRPTRALSEASVEGVGSSKALSPFFDVVFSMPVPAGVSLASFTSSPKVATAPVVAGGVLTWTLGSTVKPGGKAKVSLKLVAGNCTTPAALPLEGKFDYNALVAGATTAKSADACLKKPLYVWRKGCPDIPKPIHGGGKSKNGTVAKPGTNLCTCDGCKCTHSFCKCPTAACQCTMNN